MGLVKAVSGNNVKVGGSTVVAEGSGYSRVAATGPQYTQSAVPAFYDPGPGSGRFFSPAPPEADESEAEPKDEIKAGLTNDKIHDDALIAHKKAETKPVPPPNAMTSGTPTNKEVPAAEQPLMPVDLPPDEKGAPKVAPHTDKHPTTQAEQKKAASHQAK